jgi:hypothetical protein
VRASGVVAGEQAGGGTLLTEPLLVVNQKAKLVEVNAEYAVYDHGKKIGAVREIGQNLLKKAVDADVFGTRRFHIVDATGNTVLSLLAPAMVFFRKR